MEKLNINSKIILNNGTKMPVIGIGTYKCPDGEPVINEVKWAIGAGYRLIDTAKIYKNEEGVGKAIRESGVPREELFVTTKLWNADQGYEKTLLAIDESLKKLGLTYVDLYLIHWPANAWPLSGLESTNIKNRQETWRAMEEIYRLGKAKAIGVSNYAIKHLEEMKKYAKIPPAVNQVEFHPFLYQKELLDYCKENNIVLNAYRSLTGGKKMKDKSIEDIAKKYSKTNAQLLLRWGLQHGCVVLPKSLQKERIEENINVFDFEISEEDMMALDALNENMHFSWDPSGIK